MLKENFTNQDIKQRIGKIGYKKFECHDDGINVLGIAFLSAVTIINDLEESIPMASFFRHFHYNDGILYISNKQSNDVYIAYVSNNVHLPNFAVNVGYNYRETILCELTGQIMPYNLFNHLFTKLLENYDVNTVLELYKVKRDFLCDIVIQSNDEADIDMKYMEFTNKLLEVRK